MACGRFIKRFKAGHFSLETAIQKPGIEMNTLDDYFRSQQIPLQWSPLLRTLGQELSANADAQALRQLFFNTGSRLAITMQPQFQGITTLSELTEAFNDLWARMSWGCVALQETTNAIQIEHRFAPLAEAFGDDMLEWSVGVLEGFYQAVFHSFGASEKMVARYIPDQSDALNLQLRLAP
jgi:Cellulose synthase subunit D